jgi:hypothetical protein
MPTNLSLLAAQTVDARWWERFRENPNAALSVWELLATAGAIAAITLVWWLIVKWQQRLQLRQYESPAGLFRELCHAHRLSWRERKLLWGIARAAHLAQPAQLFLRPDLYWPPHVPAKLANRQRELVKLHGRIFGVKEAAQTDCTTA